MSGKFENVIAIEAAVAGGSLSLFRRGERLAGWTGDSSVSRAEDILINIDKMLRESGVSKKDLDLIAVSAGPGSFTGIRIGNSTALGLAAGLGFPVSTVSVLFAVASQSVCRGKVVVAIPMGRNAVCTQSFLMGDGKTSALDEPITLEHDLFLTEVNSSEENYILHGSLAVQVTARENVFDAGYELSSFVGAYCWAYPLQTVEPIFVSKSF